MNAVIGHETIQIEQLLRSINILYDADKPDRIAHFYPTSKAIVLVQSLLGLTKDKAFFITAPYGSGKSLTATYCIQALENGGDAAPVLSDIASRIGDISVELHKNLEERIHNKQKGIAIALQGYVENLPLSIKGAIEDSLTRMGYDPFELLFGTDFSTIKSSLSSISQLLENNSDVFKNILLVWDEFGRHIETLISEGRSSELNDIQTIAEFASRFSTVPFTLGLLLHQNLMNYVGKSPQSIKKEWKKIEGRFETIQYVDDSKEIYNLISNVIETLSPGHELFEEERVNKSIQEIHSLGLFNDFEFEELVHLLRSAYPCDPVALNLLPKIASRVAQHERTIFTFLNAVDLSKAITAEDVFDYFSTAMSGDTSIGGTYHQWLEAQSAITKADTPLEIKVLKTACLLGLGMSGERSRTSLEYLRFAVKGYWGNTENVGNIIQGLINKKLLLYRKNTNSVSIWHGTDINLLGRLEEEKERKALNFNLIEFLQSEIEPVNWKPIQYNNDFFVQRYFRGIYIGVPELEYLLTNHDLSSELETGEDGRIYYIFPTSENERVKAVELVEKKGKNPQVIWAIPTGNTDLYEIALEVKCFHDIQEDASLIESDPLILPELQQLTDDATEYLQRLVDISVNPSPKGPELFYNGRKVEKTIDSPKKLRHFLSVKTKHIFDKTPKFNNEMINRKNPRKPLVNARKKLLFGILDRVGMKDLGLEGYTPDVSMFRTILLHTGLYRKASVNDEELWSFAQPEELTDEGLSLIWAEFKDFFTSEKKLAPFTDFFTKLQNPPTGVRHGVIPILTAAAMRAFPSTLTITDKNGNYLDDILPSTVEDICAKADEYFISVHALDNTRKKFLKGIYELFAPEKKISSKEMDLMRQCFDALESWKSNLPAAALTSRKLSSVAQNFQRTLQTKDPEVLFFHKLPSLFNSTNLSLLINRIKTVKEELEGIVNKFYKLAYKSILNALQVPYINNIKVSLQHAVARWSSYFSPIIIKSIPEGIGKAFINRLKLGYDNPEKLVDSVATLILGKPVNKWDDSSITVFDREVHDIINQLEEFILQNNEIKQESEAVEGITELARSRIDYLYRKLQEIAGKKEADKILDAIKQGS